MFSDITLAQASQDLADKKYSSKELTQYYLDRIKKINPELNSYLHLAEKSALEEADLADSRIAKGQKIGPLDGVPAGIKDIFNTKGLPSTCASKMLETFIPPYDASSIQKLKNQGLVILGKTNTDEFACGGSTEHSAFGVTKNPWNDQCVAGGSSGGSAAAVAADLCVYALGTDTGGSIRQPAAFCGVSGLKVTYGRVSRSGVTAMASSLDTIGPFGKTAEDLAIIMEYLAGPDIKDSTTPKIPVPAYTQHLNSSLAGKTIGIPKEYFPSELNPEIAAALEQAKQIYTSLGCKIKEVSLPYTKYGVAVYYIIMPAELSANLSRFDGIRFGLKPSGEVKDISEQYYQTRDQGFGEEVKRRILTGTYVLSAGYFDAYYKRAQKVRTLVKADFERVFQTVDILLTPVAPGPAFKVGEKTADPLSMYLEDAFTIPASIAGMPAISIPAGLSAGNLPLGMQLIGKQFSEELLLNFAHQFQQKTDHHQKRPH